MITLMKCYSNFATLLKRFIISTLFRKKEKSEIKRITENVKEISYETTNDGIGDTPFTSVILMIISHAERFSFH